MHIHMSSAETGAVKAARCRFVYLFTISRILYNHVAVLSATLPKH